VERWRSGLAPFALAWLLPIRVMLAFGPLPSSGVSGLGKFQKLRLGLRGPALSAALSTLRVCGTGDLPDLEGTWSTPRTEWR
jgi:hypothetical protein